MHVTIPKSTFFRQRLNAEHETKYTVGGNKFQTSITRSEKSLCILLEQ